MLLKVSFFHIYSATPTFEFAVKLTVSVLKSSLYCRSLNVIVTAFMHHRVLVITAILLQMFVHTCQNDSSANLRMLDIFHCFYLCKWTLMLSVLLRIAKFKRKTEKKKLVAFSF